MWTVLPSKWISDGLEGFSSTVHQSLSYLIQFLSRELQGEVVIAQQIIPQKTEINISLHSRPRSGRKSRALGKGRAQGTHSRALHFVVNSYLWWEKVHSDGKKLFLVSRSELMFGSQKAMRTWMPLEWSHGREMCTENNIAALIPRYNLP